MSIHNIEIGTNNYILSSDMESLKENPKIIQLLKPNSDIRKNKEISLLDIKFEEKVLRINIFDLFTLCVILDINLNENDINILKKQYNLFRKNNTQVEHEQLLYLNYLDDLNEIIGNILKIKHEIDLIMSPDNLKGGNNKILNRNDNNLVGGVTIENLSEDILNNMHEFNSNVCPKLKEYTKILTEQLNDILKQPKKYSKELYQELLEKISHYKQQIIYIINLNEDIKYNQDNFLNSAGNSSDSYSEINKYIEKTITNIESLNNDLKSLNYLLTMKKLNQEDFEDLNLNENEYKNSDYHLNETIDENGIVDYKYDKYTSLYLVFIIIITLIIISIIIKYTKHEKIIKHKLIDIHKNIIQYSKEPENMLEELSKMKSTNEPKFGVDIFGDIEVDS